MFVDRKAAAEELGAGVGTVVGSEARTAEVVDCKSDLPAADKDYMVEGVQLQADERSGLVLVPVLELELVEPADAASALPVDRHNHNSDRGQYLA